MMRSFIYKGIGMNKRKWMNFIHLLVIISIFTTQLPTVIYAEEYEETSEDNQEEVQEESSEEQQDNQEESSNEESSSESDSEKSEEDNEESSENTSARKNSAGEYTNDLIEQSERSKQEAESEKRAMSSNLTDIKAMLSSLEKTKSNLADYITELDSDLEDINDKIEALKVLISDKEFEIEVAKQELVVAKEIEEKQYATMKRRVKFMYEKGENSSIEMLLSSRSMIDFLNKAEFINRISSYDRKMLDSYIASKNEVAKKQKILEEQEAELEATKNDLEAEQAAVETLMSEKEKEITVYEKDIDNKQQAIDEYEAMIAEQDQIIRDLEAAIKAERERLEEENRRVITYDGGAFKWPAPSYKRISDDYGNRMHPTLGVQKFHNGIDLAAPSGSPILAAYDGEVIAASYSSTMGNYVMIDHGDGLITIYMHASSLGVSQGQEVTKGQQIAKVGSTGRSTGPHLHFGVRLNGSYVSPWKYLSK